MGLGSTPGGWGQKSVQGELSPVLKQDQALTLEDTTSLAFGGLTLKPRTGSSALIVSLPHSLPVLTSVNRELQS